MNHHQTASSASLVDVSQLEGLRRVDAPEFPVSDRVVRRLLAKGQIAVDRLREAHPVWEAARADGSIESLWRLLTRWEGVDEERVWAAAASVYGFAPVRISLVGTLALVHHLVDSWSRESLARVVAHGALPVVADAEVPAAGAETRLVVVSHDPGHPGLRLLADDLVEGSYQLRYARRIDIDACIEAVASHIPGAIPDSLMRMRSLRNVATLRRAA